MKRPHRVPALEAAVTASLLIAACSLTIPSEDELFKSGGSGGDASSGADAGGGAGRGGGDPAGGTNNPSAGTGGQRAEAGGAGGGGGGEPAEGGLGGTPASGGTPGVGAAASGGVGGDVAMGGEGGVGTPFIPLDPTDGLILHYKFDETEGTTAYDEYDEAFDGVVHGKATWVPEGKIGGALKLSGEAGTYVDVPPSFMNSLEAITVSVWFYQDARPVWARVFDFGANTQHWFYFAPAAVFASQQGSRAALDVSNAIVAELHMPANIPPTKQWVHVAITWHETEFHCYIDGKLIMSEVVTPPSTLYTPTEFVALNPGPEAMRAWLGRSSFDPDPTFQGSLDDFRVYDRVLSASEVAQLHELSE